MKAIDRLMLTILAVSVASPLAFAAEPMLRPTGPNTGIREMVVAAPPPPAQPSGGYVCSIEMVGAVPDRPYGAVQFTLTPGRDCAGGEIAYVVYIATDDIAARDPGSHAAFTEAHAMALQQGLVNAAREEWRVLVERTPGSAVVQKLTIRVN